MPYRGMEVDSMTLQKPDVKESGPVPAAILHLL